MSASLLVWLSLVSLIALTPPSEPSKASRSGVDVLKDRLNAEYTSPRTHSFHPLPRSSVELHVEEIYFELLLTDKDEAISFYKDSRNHRELFLPPGAGKKRFVFEEDDLEPPRYQGQYTYTGFWFGCIVMQPLDQLKHCIYDFDWVGSRGFFFSLASLLSIEIICFSFFPLETSRAEKFSFLRGNSALFTLTDGTRQLDVVVLGAAGSGKTTAFTRRLPYGWTKGELFQEVELLFIITVRNSKEASLQSLLGLRSIGLKEQERKDVEDFLETNDDPRKILIVVDGT